MKIVAFFYDSNSHFMITVYVLKNSVNEEHYTGMSFDVHRRLKEHNSGKNRFTRAFMPWYVIYKEEHQDYASARIREKYLKSYAGKMWLKKQLGY